MGESVDNLEVVNSTWNAPSTLTAKKSVYPKVWQVEKEERRKRAEQRRWSRFFFWGKYD